MFTDSIVDLLWTPSPDDRRKSFALEHTEIQSRARGNTVMDAFEMLRCAIAIFDWPRKHALMNRILRRCHCASLQSTAMDSVLRLWTRERIKAAGLPVPKSHYAASAIRAYRFGAYRRERLIWVCRALLCVILPTGEARRSGACPFTDHFLLVL